MGRDDVLHALRLRLRSRRTAAAVLLISGAVALSLFPGWAAWRHPARLTSDLLVPLCIYASYAYLAPVPWQWGGPPGGRPSPLVGLLRAALAAGLLLLAVGLWDIWLLGRAGVSVPFAGTLLLGWGYHGLSMPLVGGLIAHYERSDAEKAAAMAAASQAQVRLMQSRLHPQVLFRALEGLEGRVESDPAAAEQVMRALAGLLRRLLRASERSLSTLGEERAMVDAFVEVAALRPGGPPHVAWTWDPGLEGLEVMPLLLQPLVEAGLQAGGPLALEVRREGGRLLVRLQGPGLWGPEAAPADFRRRLDLSYGGRADLEVRSGVDTTDLRLRVPLEGSHDG